MDQSTSVRDAREAARHRDGEFGTQHHGDPGIVDVGQPVRDLTTEEPPSIDAELYDLYVQRLRIGARMDGWISSLKRALPKAERGDYTPIADRADAYLESADLKPWDRREIERDVAEVRKLQGELRDVAAKEAPLNAEFSRRGGWTRAFLVSGLDGHVHSWMNCQTCNRMGQATRFQWMTDYSGQTEEQIVDAAGERACTVCYPTAPVNEKRPTRMFSDEEVAAAEARKGREAAKAEKAAKAAAVAVYDADGAVLTVPSSWGRQRETVKSERAASNLAIGAARDLRWYKADHPSAPRWTETLDLCVAALARKRGLPESEVRAEIEKKAAKPTR